MLKLFYSASLYVYTPTGRVYEFQFQGQEEGMTGIRDAQIFAQAQSQDMVSIAPDPATGQPKCRVGNKIHMTRPSQKVFL